MDFCKFIVCNLQVLSYLLLSYANHGLSMECSDNHQNIFAINPANTSVKEGENATFTCAIANVKESDRIIWLVNPSQYHSVIRNSFDESTDQMVSKITVYNVGRIPQNNQCVLYIVNSDFSISSCYSRIATLVPQYFPKADDIECGSYATNPLQNGDQIQTWCAISTGNPSLELQWMTEEQNSLNQSHHQETGRLTQEIKVTPALHKKPITCTATSPEAFPNQLLSCNVGPFVVYHKPQVSVTPREATLYVVQKTSVKLTCQAEAYPPITYFSWSCFPFHTMEGCQSSSRSINVTLSTRATAASENGTILFTICTAGNVMGNSSFSTSITIINTEVTQNDIDEYHMIKVWNGSNLRGNHATLHTERFVTYEAPSNATEANETQHMLSADSMQTSPKIPPAPLSTEDVNIEQDDIKVKVNGDDFLPKPRQPHNVYIISTASVVAGILLSAGLFAVISIVLYRHFKDVTTQIATHVQCQHDPGNNTSDNLRPELHSTCADKDPESTHIYEDTGFLNHSAEQYAVTQTLYNTTISKESSDSSGCSSTSSSYKSSGSLESGQEDVSYSTASFDSEPDRNELEGLYGNKVVIQMQARSSNKIHFPHPKGFHQNCITFPKPPPLPRGK